MYHLIKDSTQPTYMVNSFNPTFQNLSPQIVYNIASNFIRAFLTHSF